MGIEEYYLRPLDDSEQKVFIEWLELHIFDVWLKFKKHHIIYDDDFSQINVRVIKNHVNIIQKALEEYGYKYELNYAILGNRFAIIDSGKRLGRYEELMREHYNL